MTVDVSVQSTYALVLEPNLGVATHSVYALILPGERTVVSSHSVYALVLPVESAGGGSGRRLKGMHPRIPTIPPVWRRGGA